MINKNLVVRKTNALDIPIGQYKIVKVKNNSGGYGHGPHDYYPPYETITIKSVKGEKFTFNNASYVKNYLDHKSYIVLGDHVSEKNIKNLVEKLLTQQNN